MAKKRKKAAGTSRARKTQQSENVHLVLAVAAVLAVMGGLFWWRIIY